MRTYPDDVEIHFVGEVFYYSFPFVDEVPSGDTIRAVGAGSASGVTGVDETGAAIRADLLSNIAVNSTSNIRTKITLTDLDEDKTYLLTATAEMTSTAERYEKFLLLKVRSPEIII